ncbi:SH3 domain-containing protein [Alkalibacterium subtropicum]|uniref:SH3 domain-containing protein n=1 Tax=Alkalibacterium subtropicum TaxID=753702 RepID=A0A1I1HJC6_9LACT|nr:SH3 domain-containing protein [Alkalibacterium subtropicum]SFC23855.1 SH3 domain-containing protein [Alkalibacterium subtropicum]
MLKRRYLIWTVILTVSVIGLSGCMDQAGSQDVVPDTQQEEGASNEEQDENQAEDEAEGEQTEESNEVAEQSEEPEEEEEESISVFGNQENNVYISDDGANVKAASSEESETLGRLIQGNEVKVIDEREENETTWYQISHHNSSMNEGWVSSDYTVSDMNELHSSTSFDDEELNDFFTSPTLFEDNRVVAYYGHPNSEVMGIVGRHPVEELIDLLKETTETYDEADEDKGAIPAIYLVYGTVQPGGVVLRMNHDLVMSYIEAAYEQGVLVYIDHQMGSHHPTYAINEILSFLRYPNVHLALDPEWRTERPMQEVGHITGQEINEVQEIMKDYIESNDIPGTRQFVFHQFVEKMIHDVEAVSTDYESVLVVHNTSGWGSPDGKKATHKRVTEASPIPYKGFKLWYHYSDDPGVHYDNPLMTPEEVLNLDPEPNLVIYQ